ncbi:MAG: glycoside hydrolase family 2 TIM barrel-domain containing protein [Bacteroidales bacterium]
MKVSKSLSKTILFCILINLAVSGVAQINYQNKQRMNEGWEFLKQDLGSVWEAVRPFRQGNPETVPLWEKVTLPHCFNAEDAVDPYVNYYQGPGWYRTTLNIDNPYKNGRTILHFEGAGQKTEVYIFTTKVGSHVGGYDEWTVDITNAVADFLNSKDAKRFDGKIPLSIRCDNTRDTEMIPSDLSDFNIYGGIYRYLNLVYTPALSLSNVQVDATVDENGKNGELSINTAFANYSDVSDAELSIKIFDPSGKIIRSEKQSISSFDRQEVLNLSVPKPERWSPSTPNLYACELTISSSEGETTVKEFFGFRHFEFEEKGPFYLNGERLLLRGTHRHEDHAGVGQAMTEKMIVEEMKLMKSMGVNFIRLGHYQQSRIVLEQCDKLGILVWEEIPWCRGGLGGDVSKAQAKRMLTNMITQHRNHPSVILWGLGNENDWPNDFPDFDKEKIRSFMSELHNLSHELDDTRLTCIRRCGFCKDVVDVYSPSIWAGWYRGLYTDYKKVSYEEMQKVKHFLHVEWGGDSHAGRHAENSYEGLDEIKGGDKADERAGDASMYGGIARASKDGDWSESYICDLVDWHLKEQETMPWLTGAAYWPFKDFSTPVRPENPVPYMNQKGVVERDLTPKESFYVFKSYWTEEPMVHIYGHSWETRWGKADEQKIIKVYSNCTEVELFLNGKSLGVKKRNSQDFPAAGLRWNTKLQQGENVVEARAVAKGSKGVIEDKITFDYETRPFGEEAQIKARVISENAESAWIEVELQDEKGIVCLESRKYVEFASIGDGYLIVNKGTSTASKKVQVYNGRARVQLKKNGRENVVSVKAKGLETVFVDIKP